MILRTLLFALVVATVASFGLFTQADAGWKGGGGWNHHHHHHGGWHHGGDWDDEGGYGGGWRCPRGFYLEHGYCYPDY